MAINFKTIFFSPTNLENFENSIPYICKMKIIQVQFGIEN
jgi:hypothetical protein